MKQDRRTKISEKIRKWWNQQREIKESREAPSPKTPEPEAPTRKKQEFLYKFTIKGKELNIPPVLSYPYSGLVPDKVYVVTIQEKTKEVW